MTERYQGWSLQAEGHEDTKSSQTTIHSGFTAINRQLPQSTAPSSTSDINTDAHVDISHAAKHPIVAQYLGIGLGDAHVSRFEPRPTMRSHATAVIPSPASKQAKETAKKRSASTPLPKPAKKTKRCRSDDDGHAIDSASKTATRSKKKRPSAPPTESDKENSVPHDSGRQCEALLNESFALSEQTAKRLSAWRFQPSPSTSTYVEATAQSVPHTSATSSSSIRNSSIESRSLLSPVTSPDVIKKDSQGYGHSIHNSAPHLSSSNRLIISKPQAILTPPRPPPKSRRHHVLETIFEESPGEHARGLPDPVSDSPIVPICDSPEPNSTAAVDLNDLFEDDLFDDLNDGDLLDLELPSSATISPLSQVSRDNLHLSQAVQPVSPVIRRNVYPDIIDLVSDDEWNILEDEEIAFLDLTDDAAQIVTPASTATIRNTGRSKLTPAETFVSDKDHGTPITQSESTTSQQEQVSPQLLTITAAEATEDYLHAILHPPIIRPPFPEPIRDRSPLIGVSASLVLKTCFRIGECLNVGCTFARNSNSQSSDTILIELYAKVVSSHRAANGVTQHFVLADLFHEKRGPFLNATCETWRGSELWEYDCGRLLCADLSGEKKICRAVGRMKREGGKWRFVVLNIWEATWEDVEFVRGIVCGV
ncbi:hypothetical protein Vi05172_g9634 [Venturia inaequalis]|nr:hypothetical protein Vi05172_g9634 [Venturia inaequalis]